jgi:hypothetical protein
VDYLIVKNKVAAKVGTLLNSQDSWPTKGNLRVDGFVYDQIDGRALS